MRLKTLLYSAATCFCFVLSSCNFAVIDDGSKTESKSVTGVELDVNTLHLYVEEKHQFEEVVKPTNASNKKVTWTVDDASIGTISKSGLFTAKGPGQALVTVTTVDGNYSDTCDVYVSPLPDKEISYITATGFKDTYYIGETVDESLISIVAHYTNNYYQDEVIECLFLLSYTFDKPGTSTITVTASIDEVAYQCRVDVEVVKKPLTSILVVTPPNKTNYIQGEEFDPTGLNVNAFYGDSLDGELITDYELDTPNMNLIGKQDVNVYFTDEGITKSDSFAISIKSNDGIITNSIYELIEGMPYNGIGSDKYELTGVVTCCFKDSYNHNNCYIQQTDRNGKTAAILLYNTAASYEVGDTLTVTGGLAKAKRYNNLPEIDCGDSTIVTIEKAELEPVEIAAINQTAADWENGTDQTSEQFLFAQNHGPLKVQLKNVSITNKTSGNATGTFLNGTEFKIYYGGTPSDTVAELSEAITSKLGERVDITGYLQSFIYTKGDSTTIQLQLLFRDAKDIEINEGQSGTLTVNITAFNDFHGAIYPDGKRMGLGKVGTYLKQQSQKPNTLALSQGDDWQGSIYSNYNRGRLINDVYAYAHVSARTAGNHDFDWGVAAIKDNTKTGYNGYTTPVLGANIYDFNFSTKIQGTEQQSEIGVPTVSYVLDNGLKVGVVGIIGEDQITSITSFYTEEICFKSHIPVIKAEATALRNDGCDIVIASCHTGQESVYGQGLENYVDLVLCGHTHENEHYEENGLYYYQFGSYGQYIGQITLEYDTETQKVSFGGVSEINSYNIDSVVPTVDTNIQNLIDTYEAQCNKEANEVLLNNASGVFYSSNEAPNLMCKVMYEAAVAEGHKDVLLSYCNVARSSMYNSEWTYADIYQAFPFDNIVYIEEVSGYDILNEVGGYNYAYFNPSYGTGEIQIDRNAKYKIAVLDYLLYHNNKSRYYDWFSSFDGTPDDQLSLNYRLLIRNWLRERKGAILNASDYDSKLSAFNRSRLVSK